MAVRKLNDLMADFSPEEKKEIRAMTEDMLVEIRLDEIRKARKISQKQVAEHMGISQGRVSMIESKSNLEIKTLENYAAACGGRLKMSIEFDDGVTMAVN